MVERGFPWRVCGAALGLNGRARPFNFYALTQRFGSMADPFRVDLPPVGEVRLWRVHVRLEPASSPVFISYMNALVAAMLPHTRKRGKKERERERERCRTAV